MTKKSLVFGSPKAAKADRGSETVNREESKQPGEENQLQTQSMTENSKTYLNTDSNQENTIKMQIDRLQLLHGVLDSATAQDLEVKDRPMELAELKHAESPKKVPHNNFQTEEK
jgi:hypothetical protein